MGRMGSDRGRRSGAGGRPSSATDQRREPRNRNGAGDGTSGRSRLLLTRLVREGALWNVYIATDAQPGAPTRTQLEFEDTTAASVRYVRRVDGPLLDALHSGAPVSRASLQDELQLALDAGAADAG